MGIQFVTVTVYSFGVYLVYSVPSLPLPLFGSYGNISYKIEKGYYYYYPSTFFQTSLATILLYGYYKI